MQEIKYYLDTNKRISCLNYVSAVAPPADQERRELVCRCHLGDDGVRMTWATSIEISRFDIVAGEDEYKRREISREEFLNYLLEDVKPYYMLFEQRVLQAKEAPLCAAV